MKSFEFLFQMSQIELSHLNNIDIYSSRLQIILKKGPAKQQILTLPLNNSNVEFFISYYRVVFSHTFTLTQKLNEKEEGYSEYLIKLLFYVQQNKTTHLVGECVFNLANCITESTQHCKQPLTNTNDKRAFLSYSVSAKFIENIPLHSPRQGHVRTSSSISQSKSPVVFRSPNKFQPKKSKIIKIERNQKRYSKETLQTQDSDQQVTSNMESENNNNYQDSNHQSSTYLMSDSPYQGYKPVENEGLVKKFQELSNRFSNQKKDQLKQLQDIEIILSKEEDELQDQISKIDEKIKYIKEDSYHSPKANFDKHQNYLAQIATLEEINFRLEQDNDRMKIIIREMSETIKRFSSIQQNEINTEELLEQKNAKIQELEKRLYQYQKEVSFSDKDLEKENEKFEDGQQMEELKQLIEKLQSELWFSLQLCENQKKDLVASEERVKKLEKELQEISDPIIEQISGTCQQTIMKQQKGVELELEKAKKLLNQVMNIVFEIGGKKLVDQITSKLNNQ